MAFVAEDPEEWLSPVHCREALKSIFVGDGDRLVSNRRRAVLEIVRDDVGVHDATIPACDPTRYAVEFGVPGHRNCLENMWGPVRDRGVAIERMPEPLNLFQNTPVVGDGRIGLTDPVSRPGQRIVFCGPSSTCSGRCRRARRTSSPATACGRRRCGSSSATRRSTG